MIAEIPMSNPLGCQMIKVKVMKNITIANTVVMKFHLSLQYDKYIGYELNEVNLIDLSLVQISGD